MFKAAVEKIFTCDDGSQYDYVFNLAAETKYGQSEGVCILLKKRDNKSFFFLYSSNYLIFVNVGLQRKSIWSFCNLC